MTTRGKLFLLAGASGSGKSQLIRLIEERMGSQVVSLKKGTTRAIREDDQDVFTDRLLNNPVGNEAMLMYASNGARYSIDEEEIARRLCGGQGVVMIVADHGTTEYLREKFPGDVVTVFVHRDLTKDMVAAMADREAKSGDQKRALARMRAYNQLAAGLYRPDYIIINQGKQGSFDDFYNQFERIFAATASPLLPPSETQPTKGVLHIIVTPTGDMKDAIEVGAWSYPGRGRSFVTKTSYPISAGEGIRFARSVAYSFFGKEYVVNVDTVLARLQNFGVAFITVSDIASARTLRALVEEEGYSVELNYLHQRREEIHASVRQFPAAERKARIVHARMLLKQYREELVCEAEPLLPVNGEEDVVAWVQRCMRERPRHNP